MTTRSKKTVILLIILALFAIFALAACNQAYVVQFNWNCDDIEPISQNYFSGDTVQFPDSVKREGYGFCGWYTDQQCTQEVDKNVVVGTTSLTIYAKWRAWPKSLAATLSKDAVLGCELKADDFFVEVTYWDGTTKQLASSEFSVDGLDGIAQAVGDKQIVLSYTENDQTVDTSLTISVLPVAVESIDAIYVGGELVVGDELVADDFDVVATYNNGDEEYVTDFQIYGYDSNASGKQTVTINFEGKTAEVSVTVQPAKLEYILAELKGGVKIYCGDQLTKEMFVVTAVYNNGAEKSVTDFSISGYNSSLTGEQTVTITFDGNTTEVNVNVAALSLISVSATYNGSVVVGEQIDVQKLIVIATYNNGSTKQIQNYNQSSVDTSAIGTKTLEISYTENDVTKSCNVEISVIESGTFANDNLSVHFLELGNKYTGDSVYIKAGDTDILIDAGSRKDSAKTIGNYVDQYCTDGVLEYVIATHAHQDHIAGFVGEGSSQGIFERYECKNIIEFARTDVKTQIYSNYQTARNKEVAAGANCYTALDCVNNANGAQKVYDLTGDGSITMEVLYQKFYENKSSDENNYSVCVLISQGDNHYLFTGDLEAAGEASLVASNPDLPEVVLFKGGHHGSYTSSSETLLSKIKPQYVCVCCCAGTTEYTNSQLTPHTFPAQEFVNRVAKYTDKVYITTLAVLDADNKLKGYQSMNGNIVFSCINGEISLNCSNNNTKLKDTDWFKNNRTCPPEWQSDE